jgi:hypothetical protein
MLKWSKSLNHNLGSFLVSFNLQLPNASDSSGKFSSASVAQYFSCRIDQALNGSPSARSIKALALSEQLATKYVQAAARAEYFRFSTEVVGRVVVGAAVIPATPVRAAGAPVAGLTGSSTSSYSYSSTVSPGLASALVRASKNPLDQGSGNTYRCLLFLVFLGCGQ